MLTTAIVWGAGLALFLAHRSLGCLGRLCLPRRVPVRPRPLDRRMAQNQCHRSRQRMQPRLVPLRLSPTRGSHRRSLRRV